MTDQDSLEAQFRDLRDQLAVLGDKFKKMSKVSGFRLVGKEAAGHIDEAVLDIDVWMGWDDD